MEDAAVEEAELSGAAEFAPAPVAAYPFGHSVAVARPPPAHRFEEPCPPRQFTTEEEASSSSSSGKAPPPEVPPEEPAPAPTQAAKKEKKTKKVKMPRSLLDSLMTVQEWEPVPPVPPVDEEFLKGLAALIPNGEQFLADRGFSMETYRELNNMDIVMKARTDMVTELQEQLQEKGYVEMEVTDDEEEEEEGRRAHIWRGRRRFRPGVCKKAGGGISRIN